MTYFWLWTGTRSLRTQEIFGSDDSVMELSWYSQVEMDYRHICLICTVKMKNLLVYILLITTFYSGMVFAWDTDPEALVGHDNELLQLLSVVDHFAVDPNLVKNSAPDEDKHLNDHCCHGVSHLVGIMNHSYFKFTDNIEQDFHILHYPVKYYFHTLLLRPPIRFNS